MRVRRMLSKAPVNRTDLLVAFNTVETRILHLRALLYPIRVRATVRDLPC